MSPIMRLSPPLFLLLAGVVAGCAQEEPFIDQGGTVTVQKPQNVVQHGSFNICHSDRTPWSQITTLAEEQCSAHGLKALLVRSQRWQCRATHPHISAFRCVDPDMRNADGSYVNPLLPAEVAAWEKRTGKKAPVRGSSVVEAPKSESPPAAALPGPVAPPPAPISAVPPVLSPADIAGKPAMPNQPLRVEPLPPPPPPLPPADGDFKLPTGSWGDHFQD